MNQNSIIPLEDWVQEFETSEQFLFVNPAIKDKAVGILARFASSLQSNNKEDEIDVISIERCLQDLIKNSKLDVEEKKLIPHLISEFFDYVSASGKYPPASNWKIQVQEMEPSLIGKIRSDGSIKGDTVINKGAEVGRNEPCPCGSGKKFKKCCLPLISG